MTEATDLGPQLGAVAAQLEPADAGDYSSAHPRNDHSSLAQSDIESPRNQIDIILARISRLERRVQLQDRTVLAEQAEIRRARAVQLAEDTSPFTTTPLTVIVRKIRDPYVDDADLEILASCQVTLERDGELDMRKLSFANPDDTFTLVENHRATYYLGSRGSRIAADLVKYCASYEDDVYPFLNIIESKDVLVARERKDERIRAREIAERNAYLKGLVTRPLAWVASLVFSLSEKSNQQTGGIDSLGADCTSLDSKVGLHEPPNRECGQGASKSYIVDPKDADGA